jgi:hypothetical protein
MMFNLFQDSGLALNQCSRLKKQANIQQEACGGNRTILDDFGEMP